MGLLTLVRHGQAAYMDLDYDKLSKTGEEQARRLGQFWARHRIEFHRIVHGPAKRHIRTMEIAGEIVRAAGLTWPEPERCSAFDEFDAFAMMKTVLPVLRISHPEIAKLAAEFDKKQHTPEAGRVLQKLFEAACRIWCMGEIETPDLETWAQFRKRVSDAVDALRAAAKPSTNTAVFTSGGPIAATIGHTLKLDPKATIEFVWLSRNSSWSQFLFSGDRMSMHAFNAVPHLDDLNLLTYR